LLTNCNSRKIEPINQTAIPVIPSSYCCEKLGQEQK